MTWLLLLTLCIKTGTTVVTLYVKHPKRLWSTLQNNPPPKPPVNIPISVVKHVKLLVIEAIGVVGILPAALTDEKQRHSKQNNIKKGAISLICNILRSYLNWATSLTKLFFRCFWDICIWNT